jgi:hypothetical protein
MTKKILMLVSAVLALVVTIGSASAGKGGNSAPNSGSGSSIAIASINGGLLSASTGSQTPKLGSTLTFATTVEKLAGWEWPMVALSCFQDVNGDGTVDTSLTGPDIVYVSLLSPDSAFTLGGGSSTWLQRGGAATCVADLDAYGWKGSQESVRSLATTGSFAAAAS